MSLTEQIWWRILPVDEAYDNISVGIGLTWDNLLLLLVDNGLLFTKIESIKFHEIPGQSC